MKPVFDEVLIFCPSVKTGGPEALHQLGYQIAAHGGKARMVYYDFPVIAEGAALRCEGGPYPLVEHFAQYRPQALRETILGPDTLVVFPEPLSATAVNFGGGGCQRALWWLSVDNALQGNPGLLNEEYRHTFFENRSLFHLYQSDYARAVLTHHKAQQCFALSDYTDPQFIYRSLMTANDASPAARNDSVCFFPNKGRQLAERFIADSGSLRRPAEFLAIRDMTKAQVRDALFHARVYIDFGHHPGKDRVPREAAIAGAIVLLHAMGAANHFSDHPLPPEYHFTQDDVLSGRLHQRLDDILSDPETHFAAQQFYRQTILLEKELFDLQVRSFFFSGV
jgi:hypothetical protein